MKLVTMLAEEALPKCMVPVRYVTKFTAMPSVVNLSHASPPNILHTEQTKTTQNLSKTIIYVFSLQCVIE